MTARQLPSPVGKFETFMTATNQLAELDSLRPQLDEAKLRLKATRTEVAKLDQVGGGDPPPTVPALRIRIPNMFDRIQA